MRESAIRALVYAGLIALSLLLWWSWMKLASDITGWV
jgi:hypothetical protein